jgi:hypothetical protein
MNLREGTRRLALLLGLVGLIVGGFFSYLVLQSVMSQRADHQRFEGLADSSVVEQARKERFGPWDAAGSPIQPFDPKQPYCIADHDRNELDYSASEPNSSGIRTVHFENREIASIDTTDGQTLYPTPAPSAWLYLLIALWPVLGFFIPWGATRAIGWVAAGFVAGPR